MKPSGEIEGSSNGWETIADEFISKASSTIGANVIDGWSKLLPPSATILDVGCGFGRTYTQRILDNGAEVCGIDASKTLLKEYQKRFPSVLVKCETAETSPFFDKEFEAVLSIGFIFLLSSKEQVLVLQKMANVLKFEGRLLFTSPYQVCEWDDLLTGMKSQSLGRDIYINILHKQGLSLINEYTDEGGNHYYDFQKNIAC